MKITLDLQFSIPYVLLATKRRKVIEKQRKTQVEPKQSKVYLSNEPFESDENNSSEDRVR